MYLGGSTSTSKTPCRKPKKVRIGHFWFPRYRRSSLLPGLGLRLALQVGVSLTPEAKQRNSNMTTQCKCNVFIWHFRGFFFSSVSAVVTSQKMLLSSVWAVQQCFHVVPQRKLTFHMSQTFLPSVILIVVAGISFFVPSDQVNQHDPHLFIFFSFLDSWQTCSLCDNSPHVHFHVQRCSQPHPTGDLLYVSFICERCIFLEGFLHESSWHMGAGLSPLCLLLPCRIRSCPSPHQQVHIPFIKFTNR